VERFDQLRILRPQRPGDKLPIFKRSSQLGRYPLALLQMADEEFTRSIPRTHAVWPEPLPSSFYAVSLKPEHLWS
ncbi:hypothetical protein, partial [Pseudomonas aeruginosa]